MRFNLKLVNLAFLSLLFLVCSNAERDYELAKKENNIEAYSGFIQKHPNSNFVEEVESILDSLKYVSFSSKNKINEFEQFILKNPNSKFIEVSKMKLDSLRYELVLSKDSLRTYNEFIKEYPDSKFILPVKTKIEEISYKDAKSTNTIKGYEDFLVRFPDSKYTTQAKSILKNLKVLASLPQITVRNIERTQVWHLSETSAISLNPKRAGNEILIVRLTIKPGTDLINLSGFGLIDSSGKICETCEAYIEEVEDAGPPGVEVPFEVPKGIHFKKFTIKNPSMELDIPEKKLPNK